MHLSPKAFVHFFLYVSFVLLFSGSLSTASIGIRRGAKAMDWGQLQRLSEQYNFPRALHRHRPDREAQQELRTGAGGMPVSEEVKDANQWIEEAIEECQHNVNDVGEENNFLRTAKVGYGGVTFEHVRSYSVAQVHEEQEWWNKAVRWPRSKFVKDKLFRRRDFEKGRGDIIAFAQSFQHKNADRGAARQLLDEVNVLRKGIETNRELRQHIYDQFQTFQGGRGSQVLGKSGKEVGGSGKKSSGKGGGKGVEGKDEGGQEGTSGNGEDQSDEAVEERGQAKGQSSKKKKKKKKKKKGGH